MTAHLSATGALLAGGRGSRLGGVRKAELALDGTPLLDRGLAFLRGLCRRTLLLPGPHAFSARAATVPDALPDRGAPGALLAALEASDGWVFALAVDMPHPSRAAALALWSRRRGADAVLYARAGRLEPLFAFYASRCAAPFRAVLEKRGASFVELLGTVRAVVVPLAEAPPECRDGRFLASVNTPAGARALGVVLSTRGAARRGRGARRGAPSRARPRRVPRASPR